MICLARLQRGKNPVVDLEIDDLQINTVLDRGFVSDFEADSDMHFHSFYELLVCIEGECTVEVDTAEKITLSENTLCLIPPRLYHITSTASKDYKKIGLRFTLSKIVKKSDSKSTHELLSGILNSYSKPFLLTDCARLCELIMQIRTELASNLIAKDEYSKALLTEFFVVLFRLLGASGERKSNGAPNSDHENEQEIRRLGIDEFLSDHFSEPITERELAKQMSVSTRQLCRTLKKIYGVGFKQLLIEVRLHHAARLLTETDRSVEEIAYSVGYTSLSGFYSAFNNQFGISAGRYRRKFKTK